MRVERPSGPGALGGGKTVRRSGSDGFVLSEGEAASGPTAKTAVRSIGGIEALMALQGVEAPTERRRRAVARGRTALDALDELKIGLLSGEFSDATLARLRSSVSGLKEGSGDPILDSVLAEIELRVEVELAKMEPRASP